MHKPGLVLSGGGSRGSYQIGAYKALMDKGYEISAVVGTSVGAFNGAFIAQKDLKLACKLWGNLDYNTIFSQSKGLLMDVEPLRQLLTQTINEDAIRSSDIRYGLTTYNLSARRMEYLFIEDIPEGRLVDYMMASSNVPFFKRAIIDGNRYLDGAVYDPLPRKMLYDLGYRHLISIMIDINPLGASHFINDKDLDELQINHSDNLGYFLSVDPQLINQNYEMGYHDALKALHHYVGGYYYLVPQKHPLSSLSQSFNKKDLLALREDTFGKPIITSSLPLRRLLVHITLTKYWPSDYTMTWNELFTACAELTGELLDVPRYHALTLDDLLKEILNRVDALEESTKNQNHTSITQLLLSGKTDLIREDYAAIALATNHPAILPLLPGFILAMPHIVIGGLFIKIIQNRRRSI